MPATRRKRRRPRSQTEMERILADLDRSRLSQRVFAARRGIPLSTLTWWRRKLGRTGQGPRADESELVPVVVSEKSDRGPSLLAPACSSAGFEVRLRTGHLIHVPNHFDDRALQRLVSVLDAGC